MPLPPSPGVQPYREKKGREKEKKDEGDGEDRPRGGNEKTLSGQGAEEI